MTTLLLPTSTRTAQTENPAIDGGRPTLKALPRPKGRLLSFVIPLKDEARDALDSPPPHPGACPRR